MVGPDFCLEVEVYCSVPVEESSTKPSTPIKMLKKLRSKAHVRTDTHVLFTIHATRVTAVHAHILRLHMLVIKAMACTTFTIVL